MFFDSRVCVTRRPENASPPSEKMGWAEKMGLLVWLGFPMSSNRYIFQYLNRWKLAWDGERGVTVAKIKTYWKPPFKMFLIKTYWKPPFKMSSHNSPIIDHIPLHFWNADDPPRRRPGNQNTPANILRVYVLKCHRVFITYTHHHLNSTIYEYYYYPVGGT